MRITTINFEEEVYKYLKSKSINTSKYINKIIKEKMETEEEKVKRLKEEIKEKEREVDNLEENLVRNEEIKKEKITNLSEEQRKELVESVTILNKIGGNMYFEGRYNRYKNLFGAITKEEFKELLELFNKNK